MGQAGTLRKAAISLAYIALHEFAKRRLIDEMDDEFELASQLMFFTLAVPREEHETHR